MTTAIERLRASKQETVQQERIEGKQQGREWAENTADYNDLRRISIIKVPDDDVRAALNEAFTDADDILDTYFGADAIVHSDEYIGAWIKGAQEFFAEVRDKL